MKVQTAKRTIVIQEWAAQIRERIQSGQSVKTWCAAHGIKEKTYYYRLKRVREEMLEATQNEMTHHQSMLAVPEKTVFTAVPVPQNKKVEIAVQIGVYSVEIRGADTTTIEQTLIAVSRL
jgi:transposase-like protein